jgi:hypothetical protein
VRTRSRKKPNLVHITASAQSNICLIALYLLVDNEELFRVIGRQRDRFDDIIVRSLEEKLQLPELSIDQSHNSHTLNILKDNLGLQ